MSDEPTLRDIYAELIGQQDRAPLKKSWGKEALQQTKRWKQL